MTKPSDLSPLFSDEDINPEELARARRIVAYEELKENVKALHKANQNLDYKASDKEYQYADYLRKTIIALVLELFPEEGE